MSNPSIEDKILTRLQGFTEALEAQKPLEQAFTCRTVVLDLQPTAYDAQLVKQTRESLGASQAIFAQFLGVSLNTVQAWEQGKNTPSEMACRFLDEIRVDLKRSQQRLKTLAVPKVVEPR